MIRKLPAFTIALALVIACTSISLTPAHAASQATATSVALNAAADCADADLDLGIVAGDVDREYGLATNLAGVTLDEFEQDSTGLDNLDGVFDGYGINVSPDQPNGTIIGSYAYLGTTPPQAATTAEWFVLYRCGTDGDNQVLDTCFGDYGTCPRTAAQGLAALFQVTVSTTAPAPGQTVIVTASGCTPDVGRLAAVTLLRDNNLIASVLPFAPNADGSFEVPIVVPADVPAGTALVLRAVCGDGDVAVASADVALTVTVAEPVPTPPSETPDSATTAPQGSTQPRFTG